MLCLILKFLLISGSVKLKDIKIKIKLINNKYFRKILKQGKIQTICTKLLDYDYNDKCALNNSPSISDVNSLLIITVSILISKFLPIVI